MMLPALLLFSALSTTWASLSGSADPGAQIIVRGLDGSQVVVGVVGRADGTYQITHLSPGRYAIKEDGEHHATRTLTLVAGESGQVDLGSSDP